MLNQQNPNTNEVKDNLGEKGNQIRVGSIAQDFILQRDDHQLQSHQNIYMIPKFIDGKPTKGKPLQVVEHFQEPKLQIRREIDENSQEIEVQYYHEFNEKTGYKTIQKKDDYRDINYELKYLRNFKKQDGLGYLYSRHKRINVKVNEKDLNLETIKMLICITMYAEPKDFLINTLRGIYSNLKHFEEMGISSKQIVVVIIQDGIIQMMDEMVNFFSELDIKQGRTLELVRRRQIIQQQIDFLKRQNKQSVLEHNDGFPNTIPKQIALLYQDFLQFDENDKKNSEKREQIVMPTFSVFKHLNAKKLSSHLWFFEGFCRQFQPKYCALVDVGTIPDQYGLVNMFKALEGDSGIGGVSGFLGLKSPKKNETDGILEQNVSKQKQEEIKKIQEEHPWIQKDQILAQVQRNAAAEQQVQQQKNNEQNANQHDYEQHEISKRRKEVDCKLMLYLNIFFVIGVVISAIYNFLLYIIQKAFKAFTYISRFYLNIASVTLAQIYEYTTAHMIDKNFESFLGFLHVLPGAWSAYRYDALSVTKQHRENIIQKRYLKQILNKKLMSNNIQELNMFLAEDRILCLGIFCQEGRNYKLKFIPDAKAFTDPVESLELLQIQRRRWINSSYFAFNYVVQNYSYHVGESKHSPFMKKIILPLNMFFAKIGKFNTYFIPTFYLFVAILCSFQFLKSSTSVAYKQIDTMDQFKDNSSVSCKQNEETNLNICTDTFTSLCFMICNSYQVPNIFFALLNFIPAIFVVLIIMILFASLIFKPKVILTPEEESELNKLKKLEKKGNELDKNQKKKKKDFEHKINKSTSQKFQNDTFKILASLISLISCFIFIIVMVTIILSLLDESQYLEHIGIQKLSKSFKIYLLVMIGLNYGSFLVSLVIHFFFQPFIAWNILISFFSYWIYSPIYNHILLIYAFCNIDDVTWGTKGLTDGKQSQKLKEEKIEFVGVWILWNAALLTVLLTANSISSNTPYVIMILGGFGAIYSFIKTFFGLLHYLKYFLIDKLFSYFNQKKQKLIYTQVTKQIEDFYQIARKDQIQSIRSLLQAQDSFEDSQSIKIDLNDSMTQLEYQVKYFS
ncbi:hypothetical protein ABPG72_010114 [Tetrahymena utriculariae]